MFSTSILNFGVQISALRQFVAAVEPAIESDRFKLTDFCKTRFGSVFLAIALPEIVKSLPADHSGPAVEEGLCALRKLQRVFDGKLKPVVTTDEYGRKCISVDVIDADFLKQSGMLTDMVTSLLPLAGRQKRSELLYESALVSLVSATECLVAGLLHAYYEMHPTDEDLEKSQVQIAELRELGTVEEAIRYKLSEKIAEKIRGFPNRLVDFVKKRTGYSGAPLSEEQHELTEIFQRRHMIVHNGGRASSRYLLNVPQPMRNSTTVGDVLTVTRNYLDDAIDRFERQFLLFAFELWRHVCPTDKGREPLLGWIADIAEDGRRWRTCECFCRLIMDDKTVASSSQPDVRLTYSLALKCQGRFSEVKNEVESFVCPEEPSAYRLVKAALLDDVETVLTLLPENLAKGFITPEDATDGPLFDGVRNDVRFRDQYPPTHVAIEPAPVADSERDM